MAIEHTPPVVIVEQQVTATMFACDLAKCKGACCTMKGGSGAPVSRDEIEAIEGMLQVVMPALPATSRAAIEANGFWELSDGELSLRCVDDRDCVFVMYEGDVAVCALEKSWQRGEATFRKPLSCHLFPIRRRRDGFDRLYVEYLPACDPGYRRGRAEGIPLARFERDALVRAYGSEWYDEVIDRTR